MPKNTTWLRTRQALSVTALAALVTGGAFLGSGTASAATTLANQCTGSVSGSMGDTVALPGSSVSALAKQAAAAKQQSLLWIIPLNGVDPNGVANALAGQTLTVGQVPSSSGGAIDGKTIGSAVGQALQGNAALGWSADTKKQVLDAITTSVASNCGLTTLATNYSPPTSSSSTPPSSASPSTSPTTTNPDGSPLANLIPGSTGTAPQRDYNGIPTATPGTAVAPGVRYPANGTLPGSAVPETGGQDPQSQGPDVRNAGNAEALATSGGASDVQLPMLLAVIVLAGVTAGLVRTWVLRRAS
ncbi:hypothetical protein VSH64_36580 [Amycolatopsis rhabdoformis]|uniref:Uncharacterized protein n=1 Tax=Amycolatopsis rhabdoformis TaxID=1448059 RepID=A0ABZ1I2B9_9PSEU|nr:hypothetical protein [Amycolatopsis rhabdoformis]WSE28314.1 hypothetical protein VSH64_36580 [Amycolatopsis rhabdoformis]